ncbi:hypothetical protein [Variovorax paradoxus]|uniref:Uncharacterized protein n=1 Tax=Variovorax paradoxus TaxID=34073 RepID=A0A679JCF0_VARPD|nr:hypothetical protein VVAX_04386 [Variovorax paradoxus]
MTSATPITEAFEALAKSEGHDVAYTYDTERSRHIYLSPMTADLWRYYRAATERAAVLCEEEAGCASFVNNMGASLAAEQCAAAIRASSGKGEA